MAPAIISRMVRSSLAPVWETLGQAEHRFTPEEVQILFEGCEVVWLLVERLRDSNALILGAGGEARALSNFLGEAIDTLDAALSMFGKVREVATKEALPFEEKEERLSRLEAIRQRTADLKAKYAATVEWLSRPPPRVDPAVLERAKKGPFVSIDEVIAGLKAAEA